MKKLILVTLAAFAASWLLAEARRSGSPEPPRPIMVESRPLPPSPPEPPHAPGLVRKVSHKKGDGPRPKHESAAVPAPLPPPSPKGPPPSWFPKTEAEEAAMGAVDSFGTRVVVGRVSASEDRARQDLRRAVEEAVGKWLSADVPMSWKVPARVLDSMAQASYTQEVTRKLIGPEAAPSSSETPDLDGLYTLYRAGQKLDFSSSRKARIIAMYRQELANQRLQRLGGGLALVLVTLAAVSGYIKADEATKGYYTNRLRFLAAAGLGAAGVVVYRLLA